MSDIETNALNSNEQAIEKLVIKDLETFIKNNTLLDLNQFSESYSNVLNIETIDEETIDLTGKLKGLILGTLVVAGCYCLTQQTKTNAATNTNNAEIVQTQVTQQNNLQKTQKVQKTVVKLPIGVFGINSSHEPVITCKFTNTFKNNLRKWLLNDVEAHKGGPDLKTKVDNIFNTLLKESNSLTVIYRHGQWVFSDPVNNNVFYPIKDEATIRDLNTIKNNNLKILQQHEVKVSYGTDQYKNQILTLNRANEGLIKDIVKNAEQIILNNNIKLGGTTVKQIIINKIAKDGNFKLFNDGKSWAFNLTNDVIIHLDDEDVNDDLNELRQKTNESVVESFKRTILSCITEEEVKSNLPSKDEVANLLNNLEQELNLDSELQKDFDTVKDKLEEKFGAFVLPLALAAIAIIFTSIYGIRGSGWKDVVSRTSIIKNANTNSSAIAKKIKKKLRGKASDARLQHYIDACTFEFKFDEKGIETCVTDMLNNSINYRKNFK